MEPNQQNKQTSKIEPETWKYRTDSDQRRGRQDIWGKKGEEQVKEPMGTDSGVGIDQEQGLGGQGRAMGVNMGQL